jgi:endonuclease-3
MKNVAAPEKQPFDIDRVMTAVSDAVSAYPPASLFQLADEGYGSLFEILVACILSIRTRDEDMLAPSRRLFARAKTPAAVAALEYDELLTLIEGTMYPTQKADTVAGIARRVVDEQQGELPADEAFLLSLRGVGPKCTNLALGIACGPDAASHVPVDIHVHRITNRWGYVAAKTPEKTMAALDVRLPARYRLEINRVLVPFGKHICTGTLPHCSTCPVLSMCQQVGVTKHR